MIDTCGYMTVNSTIDPSNLINNQTYPVVNQGNPFNKVLIFTKFNFSSSYLYTFFNNNAISSCRKT